MIDLRFVPMDRPAPPARVGNTPSPFKARYNDTLDKLEVELGKLGAKAITVQAGYKLADLRNDGWPRAGVNPSHPAIILTFRNRKGEELAFKAFRYGFLKDNMRAIVLTLEALRAVDRYGVVEGEQYSGFKQLGPAPPAQKMSRYDAALLVATYTHTPKDYILEANADMLDNLYRTAAKRLHPDVGGNHKDFQLLQDAMVSLREGCR